MRKIKLIIIAFSILLLTGCTVEYDLKINNLEYNEEINIISNKNEEIKNFDKLWEISINKEEYDYVRNLEDKSSINIRNKYNYRINGNELTFDHKFDQNEIVNSTAILSCYNLLNITENSNKLFISTSNKVECFKNYPTLESVTINIIVNDPVIKHNADQVNGNKYTWKLKKSNANNKQINMIIEEQKKQEENKNEEINSQNNLQDKENSKKQKKDYSLYIFLLIIMILVLIINYIVIKNKDKFNEDDD